MLKQSAIRLAAILAALVVLGVAFLPVAAQAWSEEEFARRPVFAYPLPRGHDDVIGNLITYQIQKGDTLLDVGRWFGLTAKEISDANGHTDWWTPPAGKDIVLPEERILPDGSRVGIVLNIPEMRLYYYYPSPLMRLKSRKRKSSAGFEPAAFSARVSPSHRKSRSPIAPEVVYTFPVGLGRFDWKTPVGPFVVRGKTVDPTWVVPQDIYEEHLERDGEAEHVIPGGDPDNPLGHYRLELSLPEYAIHGTNVPWGVGMEVSHGCIRLYPEDIEHLFNKVKIGTPGAIVYQPIKFGWRGDALYVEVHDDFYGKYPGLWSLALQELKRKGLEDQVDLKKLEQAVVRKSGVPTYVLPGPNPDGAETVAK